MSQLDEKWFKTAEEFGEHPLSYFEGCEDFQSTLLKKLKKVKELKAIDSIDNIIKIVKELKP